MDRIKTKKMIGRIPIGKPGKVIKPRKGRGSYDRKKEKRIICRQIRDV